MRKVLVLVCALALALGGFAPAEAQEEDAALYQSELGYAIALPDETWFKLDAQTYAQYADTELGAAFAGLGLTEETVGLIEGSNMEYFYTSAAPEQNLNVQVQAAMDEAQQQSVVDLLRQTYEAMGVTDFVGGEFTVGENTFMGCEFTLLGQTVLQAMAYTDNASYLLSFTGMDADTIARVLTPATFA